MNVLAIDQATSATQALFVASLAGLGAPFWAPEARGGWVGLSLATATPAEAVGAWVPAGMFEPRMGADEASERLARRRAAAAALAGLAR